jgi:hypothetical protein
MSDEISMKNTKSEILKAYEEALKLVRSKETEKPQEKAVKESKKKLVESAAGFSSENIVKSISDLKINLNGTLDKVEDALLNEFKKFSDLREAIQIENTQLQEMYQIKTEADSLAVILLAQTETKEKLASEERDLAEKVEQQRRQFEQEMIDKRAVWDKEKTQRQEEIKEGYEQLKKTRKREEEEYNYRIQISRKKDADDYEEKKTNLEKELITKRADFESEFAQRESQIKAAENELNDLRKQVDNFPIELENAVKQTEISITERLTAQFKYEKDLLAKETEGLLQLKKQTVQNLETKIKEQDAFVKLMNQKTETAEKNAKDIVLKAIDSSKVQWQNAAAPARKKLEEDE